MAPELGPHLVFEIDLARPDAELREQMWESHLPPQVALDASPRLSELAFQYELTGSQVRNAVVSAYFKAATRRRGDVVLGSEDLSRAAREQLATRLEGVVAQRGSKQGLDSIVLPEDTERQVREFLDACRHRTVVLNEWGFGRRLSTGKGIVALFDGEPGTGKTYCAELLANELELVLQVVAIPHIMSKWVGETEKNIERLFSHARAQNTMLMFDEADSLFGTRVKVERSMDRFSNMEVNQLLQEIDKFEGIVILTTNLESSMDRAFKRRVGFHVKFPLPDARVRAGIWRVLVPPEAPVADDVDFEDLADRFELPGGHIKNILVRTAYRARARGQILTMDLLEAVAEDECRAAGKLFRRAGAESFEL
jgi:SpoVK/Ycf46/Vps4 family AAA+-type ATPase